jgi:hypothetical protein
VCVGGGGGRVGSSAATRGGGGARSVKGTVRSSTGEGSLPEHIGEGGVERKTGDDRGEGKVQGRALPLPSSSSPDLREAGGGRRR